MFIEMIIKLLWYILVILLIYKLRKIVLPPSNFPKNIPTIPIYVSFLGAYTSMDQKQIYEKFLRGKLENYGAVKIYFASRWNILVTRPEYLTQVFKYEDIFAKSGNHIKIPNSVLATYTGNNVISAHGGEWRLFRDVLTSAIQFPNLQPLAQNSVDFVNYLKQQLKLDQGLLVNVMDSIQRLALQNIGESYFGINFKLFEDTNPIINQRLRFVKSQIFKPLFLNFPYLDNFPIPSRIEARRVVVEFRSYFSNLVKGSQVDAKKIDTVSFKLTEALKDGIITEEQFTDNSMIVMIAGHENPLLLLSSLFYVLAKHPEVQQKLRAQLGIEEGFEKSPYLDSVLYETLRMYPPLGQIINRCTTMDTMLGESIFIPKGTYVGYNNFATGRDRTVWDNADLFIPTRWGETREEVTMMYKKAKLEASLPAFHGRKRACLGEKFALNSMKITLKNLLTEFEIAPDPNWVDRLTPGGPVCPWQLKVSLRQIKP